MSRINVIGAACIDVLIRYIDREKLFSGKYKAQEIRTSLGGDALNEAIVLKRLGKDVSLKTVAGDDVYGRMIVSRLEEEGILHDADILKKGIDTYVSIVMIEDDGERSFIGSENGSLRLLDLNDIHIDEDCKIASYASLFISKAMDKDKYAALFRSLKEKDIIVCSDCSTPKNDETVDDMPYLKYIDYFFCNESEAKALCGSDDILSCEKLFYEAGVRNVIIKLGKRGCLYKRKIYSPERQIGCIDSTGAGDSFAAGFISKMEDQEDIEECIHFANHCGSMACQYTGSIEWLEHM